MSEWSGIFYFSIISAAFLLSVMGLWFTAIMPAIDRWSKRFFLCYFIVFLLCCVFGLIEVFLEYHPVSGTGMYLVLVVECLNLSIPLPMLTVYLLHCQKEAMRKRQAPACYSRIVGGLFCPARQFPFYRRLFLYRLGQPVLSRSPVPASVAAAHCHFAAQSRGRGTGPTRSS